MKVFAVLIMMVILSACNSSNAHDYGKPASNFDLETGRSVREGDWRIFKTDRYGYDCLIVSSYKDSGMEDSLTFYIFDTDSQAKEVFGGLQDSMHSISESDDHHIIGYDDGVCDAEIKSLRYIEGNVIIYAELAVYDCWDDGTGNLAEPFIDDDIADYVYQEHEYLAEYANDQIMELIESM